MSLDVGLLQQEVIRQQGDVHKACLVLQGSATESPVSPAEDSLIPGMTDEILDWSKREGNESDSLYGSMQSEFTQLDLEHGASGAP